MIVFSSAVAGKSSFLCTRLGTRIVCAVCNKSESWGLVVFDWLVLSMHMQVTLDSLFVRLA